jgi:hypothetical protein
MGNGTVWHRLAPEMAGHRELKIENCKMKIANWGQKTEKVQVARFKAQGKTKDQ